MLPREVVSKIRHIQIATNRLVDDLMGGEYHSVFKGRGMEFDEVRLYQSGDDIRTIDWNVTSRTGQLHVKRFVEERELTVMLLIDTSASQWFGSGERMKAEVSAEMAALLAFSAIRNHDKVGAILFTDRVEKFIPPKKGSKHVLSLIRDILYFRPQGRGTRLSEALRYMNLAIPKRSVVFLLSDFMDRDFEKQLKTTNRKHDVVAFPLLDPRELELPDAGIVEFTDAETDGKLELDSSSDQVRREYAAMAAQRRAELLALLRSCKVDCVEIYSNQPYHPPLVQYFRRRERRLRR